MIVSTKTADLFFEMADHLRTVHDDAWTMDYWYIETTITRTTGFIFKKTSKETIFQACAVVHCLVLDQVSDLLHLVNKTIPNIEGENPSIDHVIVGNSGKVAYDAIAEAFDIDIDTAHDLFHREGYQQFVSLGWNIPREAVIEKLERYARESYAHHSAANVELVQDKAA
jgi:hypothetical protein